MLACLMLSVPGLWGCASADRPLQLLGGAGPVYPASAKNAGVEGHVVLVYDVSADGRVINARVVEASDPVFRAAALQAVRSWRFKAPVRDGRTVPATGRRSTVTFKLGEGREYEGY